MIYYIHNSCKVKVKRQRLGIRLASESSRQITSYVTFSPELRLTEAGSAVES
jgi:hypothetical protein